MLDKEIHVHVHTDNCEIVSLLKDIIKILNESSDEKTKQEIYNKLEKLNQDIKSTIS